VAALDSAHVIDMLEASRGSSLRSSPDFTEDGVHLSPTGNAVVGKLIATRIAQGIQRRSRDRD
jgi:lysophospholipase L1-like esterase